MTRYVHHKFRYSVTSKDYVCVVDLESTLPALLPLIWLSISRIRVSTSTQESDMMAVAFFYEYLYKKFNKSFELLLSDIGLRELINEISGFSCWLNSGRSSLNSDVIGINSLAIKPHTHDQRVSSICKFLSFLNDRYSSSRFMNDSKQCIQRQHASISNLISMIKRQVTHSLSLRTKPKYNAGSICKLDNFRSFEKDELSAIFRIIQPSTKNTKNHINPWKNSHVQFRNYLIIKLLNDYGLRKGELLLLRTDSFKPKRSGGYVLIITDLSDNKDTRNIKPNIKTADSHRTISLSKIDYDFLVFYVSEVRNKQKIPLSPFLFISSNYHPLNTRYPNTLCENIYTQLSCCFEDVINKEKADALKKITPHMFRHTWAVNTLSYLVDDNNYTLETAQDILREIGGWRKDSNMPSLYGRRFISEKGNSENIRRISNAKTISLADIESVFI